MKEFTINKNDSGQRVDKFIEKAVPLLPKSLMYKYIRTKRIKLNGKRCEISTRLAKMTLCSFTSGTNFLKPRPTVCS